MTGRRTVMTVALAAMLSVIALAQEPTRTVLATLPQQQRQGTFQSATATIPLDATGHIEIVAVMETQDAVNENLSMWLRLYRFDGATQTWRHVGGIRWVGSPLGGVPKMRMNLDDMRGWQVRAEVDVPVRMRVGASIEQTTP